jgi:hypothetical protein
VREDGDAPVVVDLTQHLTQDAGDDMGEADLGRALGSLVRSELDAIGVGNLAVVCATNSAEELSRLLEAEGIEHGRATRHGLDSQVTVVPVSLVKGLEVDAVLVVEPARMVEEEAQGMRALYVALTRATKRLAVLHQLPLPAALTPAGAHA